MKALSSSKPSRQSRPHPTITISPTTLQPSHLALDSPIPQQPKPSSRGPTPSYLSESLLSPPLSVQYPLSHQQQYQQYYHHTQKWPESKTNSWITTEGATSTWKSTWEESTSFGGAHVPDFEPGPGSYGVGERTGPEGPVRDGWRPAWLRKRVLGGFLGVFLVLVVVGEVVAYEAMKWNIEADIRGFWTFGTVIVTSLLAAAWSRIEEQAMMYTPWILLAKPNSFVDDTKEKQATQTLLLDYPSMNIFKAFFTAAKCRHMLVVSSILGTFLLRAQIILSTAIFYIDIHPDETMTLLVRKPIVHTMVVIFALIVLLICPMLYHAPLKSGITPRSPASLAGFVVLLGNSHRFLFKLSDTGASNMATISSKVAGSWYTSVLLQEGKKGDGMFQLKQLTPGPTYYEEVAEEQRKTTRVQSLTGLYRPRGMTKAPLYIALAVVVMILGGLWVIYALKGRSAGFGEAESFFMLWTCLPTLAIVLFASLLSYMDFYNRRLVAFMKLASRKCTFKEALGLKYADEIAPRTIVNSYRNKDWVVFFKRLMSFFAWLAPIFTAGLFANKDIHLVKNLQLGYETRFQSRTNLTDTKPNTGLISQVLLESTSNYPAWTYDDLVFPVMDVVNDDGQWPLTNTVMRTTIPALRARLNCKMLSISNGDGIDCKPMDSEFKSGKCIKDQSQIGFVASSCSKPSIKDSSFNFIWGSCRESSSITILQCSETIVEVKVQATLATEGLAIANNTVPIPDRDSEFPSSVKLGADGAYNILGDVGSPTGSGGLDSFFRTLVQSRLNVPVSRLLIDERRNSVSQSIQLQHGTIRAQTLSSDSVRQPLPESANDGPSPIPASVKYAISSVHQRTMQTAVISVLLLFIFILAILCLNHHRHCVLPKNPGSIAAKASLLCDSTVWWRIPPGAEWFSDKALERSMRHRTFTLGWFDGGASGGGRSGIAERSYGVGIVQDQGKVVRVELEGDIVFPSGMRSPGDLTFPVPPARAKPPMRDWQ